MSINVPFIYDAFPIARLFISNEAPIAVPVHSHEFQINCPLMFK